MNDIDRNLLEAIRVWVWSGFFDEEGVYEELESLIEEDTDEEWVLAQIAEEFEKKSKAEASWPVETDCDRLDRASRI
jgi:hypothetical protein